MKHLKRSSLVLVGLAAGGCVGTFLFLLYLLPTDGRLTDIGPWLLWTGGCSLAD